MSFDYVIGLALLFFAYRAIRAVLRSFATGAPRAGQASTSPIPSPSSYRSPRDTTAKPAPPGPRSSGSVPRATLRIKLPTAKTPSRPSRVQDSAPFIIDRPRRFPILGILAVAALIVLIAAGHAWLNGPARQPPPGRNAERNLLAPDTVLAAAREASRAFG
jgi:hypothetical protein